MGDIRLVVQGDDLGMCRAVNEGIALATTEGILTQSSVMAPTPWFGEGAAMARRLDLPLGLHVTLTCEWEFLRWAPLTPGASLRDADGGFHRTVEAAKTADPPEAIAEAHAQAARAARAGLTLTYVDPHMGVSIKPAYESVCTNLGLRFVYPNVRPHHKWASFIVLSTAPEGDRTAWFIERLESIGTGTHFVQAHPAVPCAELRAITPEDAPNAAWAEPIRAADLEALCHPDVRATIERRGIELVAIRDLT